MNKKFQGNVKIIECPFEIISKAMKVVTRNVSISEEYFLKSLHVCMESYSYQNE